MSYKPDYATPPGETILAVIEYEGMSKQDLATNLDLPLQDINLLIRGDLLITEDLAERLEDTLGGHKSFWNNLERNYRDILKIND